MGRWRWLVVEGSSSVDSGLVGGVSGISSGGGLFGGGGGVVL